MLSEHFRQLLIYRSTYGIMTDGVTILADRFKAEKVGFTITQMQSTMIAWSFDSLLTAIETIYAFAVTDEKILLSRCANCDDYFIALSAREKYCSAACRNRLNVQKSRKRKKSVDQ